MQVATRRLCLFLSDCLVSTVPLDTIHFLLICVSFSVLKGQCGCGCNVCVSARTHITKGMDAVKQVHLNNEWIAVWIAFLE